MGVWPFSMHSTLTCAHVLLTSLQNTFCMFRNSCDVSFSSCTVQLKVPVVSKSPRDAVTSGKDVADVATTVDVLDVISPPVSADFSLLSELLSSVDRMRMQNQLSFEFYADFKCIHVCTCSRREQGKMSQCYLTSFKDIQLKTTLSY